MIDIVDAFGEKVPDPDVQKDGVWACLEIDRHIDVTLYYAELCNQQLLPEHPDERAPEFFERKMREARVNAVQTHHNTTVGYLLGLKERIESGDDEAVGEWVDASLNWWTNGLASPLATFDPTDY